MEHQFTPPSSREDENVPRLRTDSNSAAVDCIDFGSDLHSGLGVRPGESNPARMLCAVLLLVVAVVVLGLGLAWWLA
ncbi:MAG: hypothetical protein M3228_09665 [Actinomycetota bacterium]|nr:hypothetical protein [Actinomycetota bacterium]